ncbi:MAG TPA: serine/threonine-protein kinase [Polyangiales bacterium]|nr:serine/threonine-protein kinase [Polyangiales bacterium]
MDEIERGELLGQTLDGRYQLQRRIGVGGTGVVFEARSLLDEAPLAIKTLRPCYVNHIDLGARLRREAEVSRRVAHPGIVRILDEGTLEDGSPYLVMPLLAGESLARILASGKSLNPLEIAAISSRVAAILHSAHAAGYVHRDVKPEHILLERTPDGELFVQLLDFGVCAAQTAPPEERARENGRVFGTPSYVSPEQASGEVDVDGRADLFSLGIVMFEALCGHLPFTGSSVSKLLLRIIRDPAPRVRDLRPDLDPGWDLIVARLLARERAERLPSARALSRALAPYLTQRLLIERRLAASLTARAAQPDNAVTLHSAFAQRVA